MEFQTKPREKPVLAMVETSANLMTQLVFHQDLKPWAKGSSSSSTWFLFFFYESNKERKNENVPCLTLQ